MIISRSAYLFLFILWALMMESASACAQQFSVASFRLLPNDVSAFITPVRDLNGEDCGLIKVCASSDFAFSTPLGIVKREDKVGEIWLYLPRGSKKITLKHAEWGIIRDYRFPSRIESHKTYELRVKEPVSASDIAKMKLPVATVRDTLILTRVDTLVVTPRRQQEPAVFDVIAAGLYGGKSKRFAAGIMLTAMKRHGGFVHLSTDFGKIGTVVGECERNGGVGSNMPFYSGKTRNSFFMINAGAIHRLSRHLSVFEGLGYGSSAEAWELAPSEGAGYVRNRYLSSRGISFEIGAVYRYRRISVAASVTSIRGNEWYGTIGVGIRLGK